MEYSTNRSGNFFRDDAPSKRFLQVGCWPHTSFGSKGKKEEVSESLFVDFTNKFKAFNFPARRPPEGLLRVDLHHLVFVFDLDSVFSLMLVSHRTLFINFVWEVHYGANPICVRYYKEVGSPPVFFTTEQNTTVSTFYRTVTRGAFVSRSKVRVLVQQIQINE